MSSDGKTGLELRSLIKKSGELEISLASVPITEPSADQVVVRVEAAPINPSDLGLLVGARRHEFSQGVRQQGCACHHGKSAGSGDARDGRAAR